MRIALSHVTAWPEVRRGGERYLHELAAALRSAGHDVTVWTSALGASSTGEVLGSPVRYLRRHHALTKRYGRHGPEVAFALQVGARLAVAAPDVWHALGTSDAAAAAAVGSVRRTRSVYIDLGVPWGDHRRRRKDSRIHQFVVDHVDEYLCLSDFAAGALRDGFGRDASVVGGGVDLARFEPGASRESTPTLLFSGAFNEPYKNVAMLLEALGLLRRRGSRVQLWLSGPGDPGPLLAAAPPEAREATRILGVGTPDELGGLYGRAWATVLPSRSEAFGLVLLESLACGTPIVTLDEGGPAEITAPGVGVVSRDDAESLADACEAALDLVMQPGTVESCRARAARWDWRTSIVPTLEAIYARKAG